MGKTEKQAKEVSPVVQNQDNHTKKASGFEDQRDHNKKVTQLQSFADQFQSSNAPIQMNGHDTGADNVGEFYLHEMKMKARREAAIRRNEAALATYEFRFYHRNFKGRSALIAAIIEKKHNLPKADYGVELIQNAIGRVSGVELIMEHTPEVMSTKNTDFRRAVLQAYSDAVEATHGAKGTGTQLGNHQASYGTYDSSKGKGKRL